MDSMASTDHGVMYGVIDFYRAARAAGVKPIIGCEVYVSPGSRFDRETVHGPAKIADLKDIAYFRNKGKKVNAENKIIAVCEQFVFQQGNSLRG